MTIAALFADVVIVCVAALIFLLIGKIICSDMAG